MAHLGSDLLLRGDWSHDVEVSQDKPVTRASWKRIPWRRGSLPKSGPAVVGDCVLALLIAAVAIGFAVTQMNVALTVSLIVLAVVNLLLAVQEVLLWRRARGAESKR